MAQEEDLGVEACQGALTLRRVVVWTYEPLIRLKALAALVDVCQGMFLNISKVIPLLDIE